MVNIERDLMQAVEFAHLLLSQHIEPGGVVIDATAGNGRDTLFLAELVGEKGKVYSFDLQQQAITKTHDLLAEHNLVHRVKLICDGHEQMDEYISEKTVDGVAFNLGYLPGGDKTITTRAETTIIALKTGLKLLNRGGIIVLVIYTGQPGGKEEESAVIRFSRGLSQSEYNVALYCFLNQANQPPQVIAVKKRK